MRLEELLPVTLDFLHGLSVNGRPVALPFAPLFTPPFAASGKAEETAAPASTQPGWRRA